MMGKGVDVNYTDKTGIMNIINVKGSNGLFYAA